MCIASAKAGLKQPQWLIILCRIVAMMICFGGKAIGNRFVQVAIAVSNRPKRPKAKGWGGSKVQTASPSRPPPLSRAFFIGFLVFLLKDNCLKSVVKTDIYPVC